MPTCATCDYCKKKLNPFVKLIDWSGRKYHKVCYKKKENMEAGEYIMNEYLKTLLK